MKKYLNLFQKPLHGWLYLALGAMFICGWAFTCWDCDSLTQTSINAVSAICAGAWIAILYRLTQYGWKDKK